MKTISLISRLETLSMGEFQDYYEHVHCLKAMKYFPFKKYRRNYILSSDPGLDFDCISEVEFDSSPDLKDIVNSQAWAMMKDDERQFMRPECIRFAGVKELPVVPKHGVSEAWTQERRFVLLFTRGGMLHEASAENLREISNCLRSRLKSVQKCSIDMVEPAKAREFPFDAIIWISAEISLERLRERSGELPGLQCIAEVVSQRSDPEVLQYRFGGSIEVAGSQAFRE